MKIIVMDVREAQLERVGVSVYCENLIKNFDKCSKFKFIFLASASGPKLNYISNFEVKYIAPNPADSKLKKIIWYLNLPKLLKQLKADLYFGPFTTILGTKPKCKTVNTLHDAASIKEAKLTGSIKSKILNRIFTDGWVKGATQIVCISKFCQEEYQEIYGNLILSKSTVIYHGVPPELNVNLASTESTCGTNLISQLGIKKDFFVFVGTIYPKKNIERMIAAFSRTDLTNYDLVICGGKGPNSESIFTAPSKYNVESNVKFLGKVDNQTLSVLMQEARAFIFPSLYEGFGLPVLEAYAMGLPVVCSTATCLPEIAGDAALFFDPMNIDELAEKMKIISTNETLAVNLRNKGYERVRQFSWKKSVEEHLSLFGKVLN
ncbi:MAG: glycosyltransferase family 1 protein [Leclercia sp.]